MADTLSPTEFDTLLDEFCTLMEKERSERTQELYPTLHTGAVDDGRRAYEHIGFDEGPKFVKVWTENGAQKSVCYFVEKGTGFIWGAAGWKARNKNRRYGTLQTMHDWIWSGYYGTPKVGDPETATLVPKHLRR